MIAASPPASSVRRSTWRRRSARSHTSASVGARHVNESRGDLAGMLVRLSRGSIDHYQAHCLLAMAKGDRSVEIVIDVETGEVERITVVGERRSTTNAPHAA